jgi:hypothetical protein
MPSLERDEFFINELVEFDVDVFVDGASPPNLSGTTVTLTVQDPAGTDSTPAVTIAPATHAHATFLAAIAGWHEWRWESTGTIKGANQGRFRVLPKNT